MLVYVCDIISTYGSTLTGVASLIADNTGGVISVLSINTTKTKSLHY